MLTIDSIVNFLDKIYPPALAESWDNVGLLLGDRHEPVTRVMTCLTVTPATVREAIEAGAQLIVSHHPFPFRAEKRWTTDTVDGQIFWDAARSCISIYSPHTAHDGAFFGVNEQIARRLGLQEIRPLIESSVAVENGMLEGLSGQVVESMVPFENRKLGVGRLGYLPTPITLLAVLKNVQAVFGIQTVQFTGDIHRQVKTVAIGCGAADEFVTSATKQADLLIVGEARFHRFLDARHSGLALAAIGHHASEFFAMQTVAARLQMQFADLVVWTSRLDCDPIRYL